MKWRIPLPHVEDARPDIAESLPPWALELLKATSIEDLQSRVKPRWKDAEGRTRRVCDMLSEGAPAALLGDSSLVYLEILLAPKSDMVFYLNEPLSLSEVEARSAPWKFKRSDPLLRFTACLNGLSDVEPDTAGRFEACRPWATLKQMMDQFSMDWFTKLPVLQRKRWGHAAVVYQAMNNDLGLCREGGEMGWFVFSETIIREGPRSFDDFLGTWMDSLERRRPLDSYSGTL